MAMNFKELVSRFDITLDQETEARYLCLIERLEYIDKKLEELGIEEEKLETVRTSNKIYKALVNYIEERYAAMLYDLECEDNKKDLK